MKPILLSTVPLLLLYTSSLYAQQDAFACQPVKVGFDKYYYFTVAYNFARTDILFSPLETFCPMPGYKKFKVIKPNGEDYVIKFIDTLTDQLFFVSKTIFDCNANACSARYFSFSVTTLPIKVRAFPKDFFDWELNKNLGVGIGYYAPWAANENLSLGVLLNAGTSGIMIDSFSTQGITNDLITTDVLTVSLGICLLFSKNFQLGVMGGYDLTSTRYEKYHWVYDKCPWIGFGMGYSFVNVLEKDI